MSDAVQGAIDALTSRANADADLRARLIADPRSTIEAETGMTVPADWAIEARETPSGVELGFANDELPEDYLEIVAGGKGDGGGAGYNVGNLPPSC